MHPEPPQRLTSESLDHREGVALAWDSLPGADSGADASAPLSAFVSFMIGPIGSWVAYQGWRLKNQARRGFSAP